MEEIAPLRFQEDYDNAGLQIAHVDREAYRDTARECKAVLVCLDVTEEVIHEAASLGCNVIISHHPLIFKPLRSICGNTYQERCSVLALKEGIAIYSAHTNLDNAPEGVNHRIAKILSLEKTEWLESYDGEHGSGLIGYLREEKSAEEFLKFVKESFNAECLMHTSTDGKLIRKVAVCGGAGGFLAKTALEKGADCFITGEMSYHGWFECGDMVLAVLGHYQSEQFTKELIRDKISSRYPSLKVMISEVKTNPIEYL